MDFNQEYFNHAHIYFIYFVFLKVHFLFAVSLGGMSLISISKFVFSRQWTLRLRGAEVLKLTSYLGTYSVCGCHGYI